MNCRIQPTSLILRIFKCKIANVFLSHIVFTSAWRHHIKISSTKMSHIVEKEIEMSENSCGWRTDASFISE